VPSDTSSSFDTDSDNNDVDNEKEDTTKAKSDGSKDKKDDFKMDPKVFYEYFKSMYAGNPKKQKELSSSSTSLPSNATGLQLDWYMVFKLKTLISLFKT